MKCIVRIVSAAAAAAVFALNAPIGAFAEDMPDFNTEVSEPPQIVFMGDSIITGYGLENYDAGNKSLCDSFANILAEDFEKALPEQAEFRMFNEGLDGRTSSELLELIKSGRLDDELEQADAVVVSIGGNDILGTFLELLTESGSIRDAISRISSLGEEIDRNLDGFEDNMPAIAKELRKRTDGRIFVQTLYDPLEDTSFPMLNDMSEKKIGRLNEIIADSSKNGSLYTVCDVAADFKGRSKELTNIESYDIHPNAEGHKEIAALLKNAITAETYTYYDFEAEKKWQEEQERLKAMEARQTSAQRGDERENEKKKDIALAFGAGAVTVLICGGAVMAARRKNK